MSGARGRWLAVLGLALAACLVACPPAWPGGADAPAASREIHELPPEWPPARATAPQPLAFGETFTLDSKVLGERRRINVYLPPAWQDTLYQPRAVLYMPDGGAAEDFFHVAGLLQVSVGNGSMRPVLLVGIENTQRRRDLTGPTTNPKDREIAPVVGGSAAFRRFLREELMPTVNARWRTTGETALMGESLAGLFTVETWFTEPELFDHYLAFDPSLWWNDSAWVAAPLPQPRHGRRPTLDLASSSEPTLARLTARLAARLAAEAPALHTTYTPFPTETHATIYHPAALQAVRRVFHPEEP